MHLDLAVRACLIQAPQLGSQADHSLQAPDSLKAKWLLACSSRHSILRVYITQSDTDLVHPI